MKEVNKLIYQSSPTVEFGTNIFVNVPTILQFDETPLISIVKEEELGYTTSIPIYHQDGTYLAKVNGTRVWPTDDGKKAGINMRYPEGMTVCEMDGKTLFEITHQKGDAFRTQAELYTPEGFFVKYGNNPMPEQLLSASGDALQVGGVTMSRNMFSGCRIGIWMRSNGSVAMGCN